MAANQPSWPREWLMTDERIGDRLWPAIEAVPAGGGIVFRHYATAPDERIRLARRVASLCIQRGLTLAVARDTDLAQALDAALVHNPNGDVAGLPFSCAVHSLEEAQLACARGAALRFVAPVFPTRSHPGRPALGHAEAVRLARYCDGPAIALGGVNRGNFEPLRRDGFYGWGGIDAWLDG